MGKNQSENKKRSKKSNQESIVEPEVAIVTPELIPEVIEPIPEVIESIEEKDDDCESIAPSEAQTDGGESIITTTSTASSRSRRSNFTKEMIMNCLDELVDMIEKEILSMRENPTKSKGIRFIKTIGKKIKQLRNHSARTLGQRRVNPNRNTNSGLLKPVRLSQELADFIGCSIEELKSRVEVTTTICKYIKENKLQNPQDGRKIIPDEKLAKLLSYDLATEKELTYYSIQSYMKHLFIK